MIIRCEIKIRPESRKRIETRLCSVSEDEDILTFKITSKVLKKLDKMKTEIKRDIGSIERESLKFFLESVKKELNDRFPSFSASVDYSGRLPQLSVREDGRI